MIARLQIYGFDKHRLVDHRSLKCKKRSVVRNRALVEGRSKVTVMQGEHIARIQEKDPWILPLKR